MVGICSYGAYIPRYRLALTDIASVWGKQKERVPSALGVVEKSVAGRDEDAVTIGYEAAWRAVKSAGIEMSAIGALFMGSESYPYAVNPSSTIIAEFLGLDHAYYSSDFQFACKAATTGMIALEGLLRSGKISYGMAIGADSAQSKPHDVLEYTAASAGVALVLTNSKQDISVELVDNLSYSSDTPDFWRRDGISYPSHGGRFTGEPAYFKHILSAANMLLGKHHMKPEAFSHAVFHMPNAKFPVDVARRLGFFIDQITNSLVVEKIGNPYSASSLLGLAATLDQAKPEQYIFMVSYGSGAGADAFIFKTTKRLTDLQKKQHAVLKKIELKQYISYVDYLRMRSQI